MGKRAVALMEDLDRTSDKVIESVLRGTRNREVYRQRNIIQNQWRLGGHEPGRSVSVHRSTSICSARICIEI